MAQFLAVNGKMFPYNVRAVGLDLHIAAIKIYMLLLIQSFQNQTRATLQKARQFWTRKYDGHDMLFIFWLSKTI